MLSHLIYVSTRQPSCTDEEIQKILQSCIKNNGKESITGVLLYSDSKFLQYLEGEYRQIIQLYDKIKADNRHKNAVMISSSAISERSFPSWQMGSKKLSNDKIEFKTSLSDSDAKIFQQMLSGQQQEGSNAMAIVKKFFN